MKIDEFLDELKDILEVDELDIDSVLVELDEWDSLSIMSVMVLFSKKFGINIKIKDIQEVKSVKDLISLSEGNIN